MRKNISSRKKCVSLWSGTRRISRPPRPVSVQPHLNSTGHCRTLSYSPSTTSLASCPPASIISFLIRSSYPRRSLSARSHSSRPATAQVPLLIAVSPASLCCLLCLPLPVFLRTCHECNTTPSPLVAALPAMVGRPATRTAERLPGLIAQSISSVCVQFVWIDCAPLTYLISHQRSGEAAMRKTNVRDKKRQKTEDKSRFFVCNISSVTVSVCTVRWQLFDTILSSPLAGRTVTTDDISCFAQPLQ